MKIKKLMAVVLVATMALTITACGGGEKESQTSQEHQITGAVVDADGSAIVIQKDDKNITFNYKDVPVQNYDNRDFDFGEDQGDVAIINYSGSIKGDDATACKVTGITIQPMQEQRLKCQLVDIVSSRSQITVNDGTNNITFDVSEAERHYKGGLKKGDQLEISYMGEIDGTNTKHALVCAIYDQDLERDSQTSEADIEVVEQDMWTKGTTNIREGSSVATEVLTTVKTGAKVQRTGKVSNGWSRVKYNGQEGYILSKYLAKNNPSKKTDETDNNENRIKGTIKYLNISKDKTSVLLISEGKYYTIGVSDTELNFINQSTTGTPVELIYEGEIRGGDAGGITVKTLQTFLEEN